VSSVLVIDDDPDSCEAVARYLTKAGHKARCSPNGREALAALSAQLPDLIILDVRMPVMDGLSMLEVIRSYLRWSMVPVALFTAYPEDPRLGRAAELGVDRVFAKSRDSLDDLLAWVDKRMGRAPTPAADPLPPHLTA
jgi:CheY-like chemotaxis protein